MVSRACIVLAAVAAAAAGLTVQEKSDSILARGLEGTWQVEPDLARRLLGGEQAPPRLIFVFTGDPRIAASIPDKHNEFFKGKAIYMAGTFTRGREGEHVEAGPKHPFVLVEHNGNFHLVWFRERDGDPMGDAESNIVAFAPARQKGNDLLFIGGDDPGERFLAFERVPTVKAPEGAMP